MEPSALERLTRALEAEPDVVFAYLFGSHARGEAGPGSDVDVGVFLDPAGDDGRELQLNGVVTGALHRDDVDVVMLGNAPLTLAFEVLKGRLLFSKDEGRRVVEEAAIMSRYHDRVYYMRRHLAYAAQALRERGYS